jgi:dGTPase
MTLACFASDPARSRGRLHDEGRDELPGEVRGPRDAFQRDRDRIIHSVAFRRLRGKTQVFVAPDGDHFRVRLTHSLEVAQIGRTIARALGLNEDLTEALCLAHDIGHPPFGHAGEDALQAALSGTGGFDHNAQTLRMLTRLEHRYPLFAGLNLSWETLEGLAKHNGPVADPPWALQDVDREFPLELGSYTSLEAQVAALADDIAYDNHDIDDGLRAGLFTVDALLEIPGIDRIWSRAVARFPNAGPELLASEVIREQIGLMVNDLIDETARAVAGSGVESVDDVRNAGRALAVFSPEIAAHERSLKTFLYANMYEHPKQVEVADAVRIVVAGLYDVYHDDPSLMPDNWQRTLPDDEPNRSRHVADFIAGMTDSYAIHCYREAVGPVELPEGF